MRALLLAELLVLCALPVHALVIDEADMLDAATVEEIEQFNTRSPIPLAVITTNASYAIAEQAAENFHTYNLQLLLFYSKAEDRAVVVQPPTEGLPEEELGRMLARYRGAHGENLPRMVTELMASMGQWQSLQRGPLPVCALLKDGKCERSCQGDLDCLCGNRICEHFENAQTCAADCKQQSIWCGIQRDQRCDPQCVIRDMDCPMEVGLVPRQQRAAFTIAVVLGGLLLIAVGALRLLRRKP